MPQNALHSQEGGMGAEVSQREICKVCHAQLLPLFHHVTTGRALGPHIYCIYLLLWVISFQPGLKDTIIEPCSTPQPNSLPRLENIYQGHLLSIRGHDTQNHDLGCMLRAECTLDNVY